VRVVSDRGELGGLGRTMRRGRPTLPRKPHAEAVAACSPCRRAQIGIGRRARPRRGRRRAAWGGPVNAALRDLARAGAWPGDWRRVAPTGNPSHRTGKGGERLMFHFFGEKKERQPTNQEPWPMGKGVGSWRRRQASTWTIQRVLTVRSW
jgi:hypothetical protein